MIGAVLLAGCSQDDVALEVTPEEPVALNFCITEAETNYTDGSTRAAQTASTRAGHTSAMNNEDLYTTGFGVMASTTAGTGSGYNKPDLMYNQEVKYTFVGDLPLNPEIQPVPEPYRGYWSYYPLKYWPTDLEHCYISAYAPYVKSTDLAGLLADETKTGIVGISGNNEAPYITYRRCKKPNEVVDLLWYYKKFKDTDKIPEATTTLPAGTLNMKMRHALARLEIQVALAAAPASGTKVLIEKITLEGNMTKTAKLILNKDDGTGDDHYPHWEDLETPDVEDRTIQITNIDNDAGSYGIIDSQVRYIPGLPYDWQPAGLKVYDAEVEGKNYLNTLSTGDRQGYIYLIPQDNLELTVTVKYHKVTSGSDVPGVKTTESTLHIPPKPSEEAPYPPLKGNTKYTLNLTLSGI